MMDNSALESSAAFQPAEQMNLFICVPIIMLQLGLYEKYQHKSVILIPGFWHHIQC